MGFLKKQFKKIFKGIKKTLAPIGRALKNGLGEVGKFFGKMGPLGTLALTLMLPGIGAAWTSFGAWAGAQGGLIGGVMNGIAQAGNLAGRVYSSVSGMISDTVGTIAGNTIGKIPVGANRNLTDVYNGFTTFVGNKLDDVRMALNLPTSNITAESIAADAAKLDGELVDRGYTESLTIEQPSLLEPDIKSPRLTGNYLDDPINAKMNKFKIEDWDELGIDPFVDRDFTQAELNKIKDFKPDVFGQVDAQSSFEIKPMNQRQAIKPINQRKAELDRLKLEAKDNVTDVVVGFDKNVKYVGADGKEVFELTPQYRSVPTNILSDEQIKLNNRLNSFTDYNNSRVKGFEEFAGKEGLENIKADKVSQIMAQYDASRMANVGSGFMGVQMSLNEMNAGQEVVGGGGYINVPPLETDTSSYNDYSRNVYPTYVQNGYRGAPNIQNMYEAGYYGDDVFSKFMRDFKSYQIPTPTVSLGGQ
jgi:hypothetical protein